MCADTREVKTMKLRDSAKQGDQSSSHPPCSANLTSSYFHLFTSWRMYSEDADLRTTTS